MCVFVSVCVCTHYNVDALGTNTDRRTAAVFGYVGVGSDNIPI